VWIIDDIKVELRQLKMS